MPQLPQLGFLAFASTAPDTSMRSEDNHGPSRSGGAT